MSLLNIFKKNSIRQTKTPRKNISLDKEMSEYSDDYDPADEFFEILDEEGGNKWQTPSHLHGRGAHPLPAS